MTAHPDSASLTHHAARRLQQVLGAQTAEVADLAAEGFDPRFTLVDRQAYLGRGPVDPAVVAEQERVDAVQHLVLVFPVHWWSVPALLKGWIDRVLIAGWAFDEGEDGRIVGRLQRLTVHLLALSGTSAASFARHGYTGAFSTQVEAGVLDFCGARRGRTVFVHDSETAGDRAPAAVEAAVAEIAAAIAPAR